MGVFFSVIKEPFVYVEEEIEGTPKQNIENSVPQMNINFIVQRHAISCANVMSKGLQVKKTGAIGSYNVADNSDISLAGVEQCFQVSDFFSRSKTLGEDYIEGQNLGNIPNKVGMMQEGGGEPITIFCCSELLRTQETCLVSFHKELEQYFASGNKIIVLPWLNESVLLSTSLKVNKTNYPSMYEETKSRWSNFIQTLGGSVGQLSADFGKQVVLPDVLQRGNWEDNFYLSPIIYKSKPTFSLSNYEPFTNKWKNMKIQTTMKGVHVIPSTQQFLQELPKILANYVTQFYPKEKAPYNINLVLVSHHRSGDNLLRTLVPSSATSLDKTQLLNCEVVKLPPYNLEDKKFTNNVDFDKSRLFPIGLNKKIAKTLEKKTVKGKVQHYPFYVFYVANVGMFISLLDLIKQKLRVELSEQMEGGDDVKLSISQPVVKYLQMDVGEYKKYLEVLQKYYRGLLFYYSDHTNRNILANSTNNLQPESYVGYNVLLQKVAEEIGKINLPANEQKTIAQYLEINTSEKLDDLRNFLFTFCSEKLAIGIKKDTIAVVKQVQKSVTQYRINFIFQRHAISCANLLIKGFADTTPVIGKIKTQFATKKNAANANIAKVGVMQCLQVADFLNAYKAKGFDYINGKSVGINATNNGNNSSMPVTIFCCSELIRTHETMYVSFNQYMQQYLDGKGKVIVLPWLNEKGFSASINADNFPDSYVDTKKKWTAFIQQFKQQNNNQQFQKDLGRGNPIGLNLETDWEKIFYISPEIYDKNAAITKFSNQQQPNYFDSKNLLAGINKTDKKQLFDYLGKVLDRYFTDMGIEKNTKVNLVMVSHHKTAEKIITMVCPEMQQSFDKQQLTNCEVIKLPQYSLMNRKLVKNVTDASNYRLFPVGFYENVVKHKINVNGLLTYPYYLFYMSQLGLFLSAMDITTQKNYGTTSQSASMTTNTNPQIVKKKSPFIGFLKMGVPDYMTRCGVYQEILQIYVKNGMNNFYNYGVLLKNVGNMAQIKKFENAYNNYKGVLPKNNNNKPTNEGIYILEKKNKKLPTPINDIKALDISGYIDYIYKGKINLDQIAHNYLFEFCGGLVIKGNGTNKVKPLLQKKLIP